MRLDPWANPSKRPCRHGKDNAYDRHYPRTFTPELSFFFYRDTDTALNNATVIMRSLIWLLLLQQPHLTSHLVEKYRESGAALFNGINAFYALFKVFLAMLEDPDLSPVYFAVDALDECE